MSQANMMLVLQCGMHVLQVHYLNQQIDYLSDKSDQKDAQVTTVANPSDC